MNIEIDLEIHFYQKDEVSICFESRNSGKDENFGEILLFCSVVLRQMVNLPSHNVASALGYVINQVGNDLVKLVDYREDRHSPEIVEYKGSPATRLFEAIMRCKDDDYKFKFKSKGFGFFARGMDFYAPSSVIALLRYLAKRRIEDQNFISSLDQAVKGCIDAYYSNKLSITTQHQFALSIASVVYEK